MYKRVITILIITFFFTIPIYAAEIYDDDIISKIDSEFEGDFYHGQPLLSDSGWQCENKNEDFARYTTEYKNSGDFGLMLSTDVSQALSFNLSDNSAYYLVEFYAVKISGNNFSFSVMAGSNTLYSTELSDTVFKKYTLISGAVYYAKADTTDKGSVKLTFSSGGGSCVAIDDVSIRKIGYNEAVKLECDFENGTESQTVDKTTSGGFEIYKNSGESTAKYSVDAAYSGNIGIKLNNYKVDSVQLNRNYSSEKNYVISFWAKNTGQIEGVFRLNNITSWKAVFSKKITSSEWTKYIYIIGNGECGFKTDFTYPEDYNGTYQMQFAIPNADSETKKGSICIDDFTITELETEITGENIINYEDSSFEGSYYNGQPLIKESQWQLPNNEFEFAKYTQNDKYTGSFALKLEFIQDFTASKSITYALNGLAPDSYYLIEFYALKQWGDDFSFSVLSGGEYIYSQNVSDTTWKKYSIIMGADSNVCADITGRENIYLSFSAGEGGCVVVDNISVHSINYMTNTALYSTFENGNNNEVITKATSGGWEIYKNSGINTVKFSDTSAYSGNLGLQMLNNLSDPVQLNQNYKFSETKVYKISFWAKNTGLADGAFRLNSTKNWSAVFSMKIPICDWTKYSFIIGYSDSSFKSAFIYPDDFMGTYQMQFAIPNANSSTRKGELHIDDFTIEELSAQKKMFSLTGGNLTYENGMIIGEEILGNKTVTAKLTCKNTTKENKNVVMIIARYSEFVLRDIKISGKFTILNDGTEVDFTLDMDLPSDEDVSLQCLKVMCIETTEGLRPWIDSEVYPNKEVTITNLTDVNINYVYSSVYKGRFYVEPVDSLSLHYKFIKW